MKSHHFFNVWLALWIFIFATVHAEVLNDWTIRHPTPYNASFFNAAYGNGVYVLVGAGGMIATSPDLQNWYTRHHPELIENIVFGNGQFVATGYNGDMLTSTDGTNWTTHASGSILSFSGVDYGNGLYVAAGEQGIGAVSSNGVDWTISAAGATNFWYWGVAYGEGRFVAVATDADYNGPIDIVTTENGIDWSQATLPAGLPAYLELWDVGYGNGRFTAVGYFWEDFDPYNEGVLILTSTDGLNWSRVTDPAIPDESDVNFNNQYWLDVMRYNGTQWIGGGDNGLVMTSNDGLNWTVLQEPAGERTDLYGLAYKSGETVLVGARGKLYSTTNPGTWTTHLEGTYQDFEKVAFNGSQYLACGPNAYVSDDGTAWPYYNDKLNGRITGIAYGKGRWVISSDSISGSTHYPLSTSTDGINWDLPTTSPDFDDCRGVAFGNDIFVAIPKTGTNLLAYSVDGLTWTETEHPWFTEVENRNFLAFGGGHFLAWGDSNSTFSVAISTNGMDWQTHDTGISLPFPAPISGAGAYGDGRWVLAGDDGLVLTSTDMINWVEQTIMFDGGTYNLNGVSYGGGLWVIVGNDQHIWSSTDGVNWDEAFWTQLYNWDFTDVVYDGSSFWTVGSQGAIYQSQMLAMMLPPTLGIHYNGDPSEVELLIGGVAGEMWNLDYKSMLTDPSWTYQTTITLTNDNHVEVQPLPGSTHGFFRLSEP